MAHTATWILVADGARAQFYRSEDGCLTPAVNHDLAVPTRAHVRDVETDRPGRAFDSAGQGRHAMEPPTPWKDHEKHLLAKAVAGELKRAVGSHEMERLVVVAAPAMMGDLRAVLDPDVKRCVVAEVEKDYTHLPLPELTAHLGKLLGA
ncbi:MAG: host attachment protein [Magnetospirillum sp.]